MNGSSVGVLYNYYPNGLEMGYFIPDALERSIVIQHGQIWAFPGHSVMFCGNNNN